MEFLRYVISDLYKKFNGSFEDVVMVLPTRRAGLFVKQYLAEQIDKPVCAPECITITDLFDSLCALNPIDDIKAICLLYDIYKEKTKDFLTEGLSLDSFYGWGRQLIDDFNNVDKNYLDSIGEDVFQSSAEAHEFDRDNLDPEVKERIRGLIRGGAEMVPEGDDASDSFKKNFELLWRELPAIYREFVDKLAEQKCGLEGTRHKWVVQHFKEVWGEVSTKTFVFTGFNLLLGTERRLMQLIKDQDKALFYWDYDKEFDEQEECVTAYDNVRTNLTLFGGGSEDSLSAKKHIEVVSTTSDNAQARFVYDWLKANHHEGQSSAVVLCNEMMLHPVVFSIPEEFSDNVNITKGFPMKHTRIFAKTISWLRNPSNQNGEVIEILEKLKAFIDKEWTYAISVDTTHDSEQESSQPSDNEGTEWHDTWYDMLNRESVFQARCVVTRFISLCHEGVLHEVNEAHTLRNMLTTCLGMVNIPFHGEPITDIQVMGVLETRALDFDNLLLLNVEEGVMPAVGRDNSFIPYYLRKYYKLTTLDDQTQVYAYNFYRLLRRASHVTILYSEAQVSGELKTMSRFVMQMLTSHHFAPSVRRLQLHCSSENVDGALDYDQMTSLTDYRCSYKTYGDKLLAQNTDNHRLTISPSALSTFLKCKRRFFLKYMLNLKEPDNTDNVLQTNELGTLIHESIRIAYSIITGNEDGVGHVSADGIDSFLNNPKLIEDTIVRAYRSMNEDYEKRNLDKKKNKSQKQGECSMEFYVMADHPVETKVAIKALRKVLENDKKWMQFEILGNELKEYALLNVPDFGKIAVGGSIDRLDRVVDTASGTPQSVVRVVDYKTGGFDIKKMKVSELADMFADGTVQGYVLQTMIYSLACVCNPKLMEIVGSDHIKPQLLFTMKDLANFDPHVVVGDKPVVDFMTYKDDFEQGLVALVKRVLEETDFSQADPTSPNSPCEYCPFSLLCGIKK